MARIRSRNTSPERTLRSALWRAGLRGWRIHRSDVPGRPDIAFGRTRVAVFVDGRFWHGHPRYFTPGKSGAYWDRKIERNRKRDRVVTAELKIAGWRVLRFWDFSVEADAHRVAREVVAAVRVRGRNNARSARRRKLAVGSAG